MLPLPSYLNLTSSNSKAPSGAAAAAAAAVPDVQEEEVLNWGLAAGPPAVVVPGRLKTVLLLLRLKLLVRPTSLTAGGRWTPPAVLLLLGVAVGPAALVAGCAALKRACGSVVKVRSGCRPCCSSCV
jgi:hypothetical protein